MNGPFSVELIPARAAVASNEITLLNAIIRIAAAEGESAEHRTPVNWVIHTVCPEWFGGSANEVEQLRSCYLNIMRLAKQNNIRTLAIPAIGVGAMHFPVRIAAENAFEVVGMYLSQSQIPAAVLFICYDQGTLMYYQAAYAKITGTM